MATYEKPTVQFHPRNKTEARQWRRDRAQLRYERNWQRTSKTHNPLTGKKNYSSPKAEIYQSKDLQKSQSQYSKGKHSHRPIPKFGGTVFAMVSLILVICLLGTVFAAYNNVGRDFQAMSYFSPGNFFSNLDTSGGGRYIEIGMFDVELVPMGSFIGTPMYVGRLSLNLVTPIDDTSWWVDPIILQSENRLSLYQINRGSIFHFEYNGLEFDSFDYIYPDGAVRHVVDIPPFGTPEDNEFYPNIPYSPPQPSRPGEFFAVWKGVNDVESFFVAIGDSVALVWNDISYATYTIDRLLPWNSLRPYSSIPTDGATPDIPWRDSDNNIIAGVQ